MNQPSATQPVTSDSEHEIDPRLQAIAEWEAVQVLCESLWRAGGHADKDLAGQRPMPRGEWLL